MAEKKKKKKNYLSNKNLLAEIHKSKEQGEMTDELAKMLMLLCERYGKLGNFINYTYISDMKSYAMMMLCRTWSKFDPEKSQNPFAFFSQCIKNSFRQYLNAEKKQRDIRDALLVEKGLDPSFTFQIENDEMSNSDNM